MTILNSLVNVAWVLLSQLPCVTPFPLALCPATPTAPHIPVLPVWGVMLRPNVSQLTYHAWTNSEVHFCIKYDRHFVYSKLGFISDLCLNTEQCVMCFCVFIPQMTHFCWSLCVSACLAERLTFTNFHQRETKYWIKKHLRVYSCYLKPSGCLS